MVKNNDFIRFLVVHGALTIILSILTSLIFSKTYGVSLFLGGFAMFLSTVLLGLVIHLITKKKQIAYGVSLIVIKYSILGLIVYYALQMPKVELIFFLGGVSLMTISSLSLVIKRQ